jgi:hypothetical protein
VEIIPKLLTAMTFWLPKFSKTRPDPAGGNPITGPGSRIAIGFYTASTGAPQSGERKSGTIRGKASRSGALSA